jgi:Tol biopolymer transport system component
VAALVSRWQEPSCHFNKRHRVTNSVEEDGDQAWSHDNPSSGRDRIVFARRYAHARELWILDLATGAERRITQVGEDAVHPAWSSDDSRIVFQDLGGIYVVDPLTGTSTRLADGVFPDWTSDGKIVFAQAAGAGGNTYDLCVISADGTGFRRLVTSTFNESQPGVNIGLCGGTCCLVAECGNLEDC